MQALVKVKKNYILLALACIIHLALLAILFLPRFKSVFITFPFAEKTRIEKREFPTTDPDLKKDWAARQTPAPTLFVDEPDEQQPDEIATDTISEPITEVRKDATIDDTKEIIEEFPSLNTQDTIKTQAVEPLFESPKKELAQATRITKTTRKPRKKQTKKELKLSDIAQSFMERMHNVPVGQLFMQGNITNMPPDKQIIFERYRTKLGAIVAQVVSEHPYPLQGIPQTQLHLYLELDRQGTFKDLHLVQSCGIPAADEYALFIYTQASKRFPPVPESLDIALFKGILRLSYYQPKPGERQNKNLFIFD